MYTADDKRYEKMSYERSGKSGLQLPRVSLGLWHNFGTNDDFEMMEKMCFAAFDHGITHFDLANNYGPVPGSAEANFGTIINGGLKSYRDEIVVSTKAGYTMWDGPYGDGGSRKYILSSLDQSLKRMNLDYVDIFYHHRMDPHTPLEESMLALDHAVKSGKALYAGISNYDRENTKQAMEILNELKCPFIINQRSYSIFDRKIESDGVKSFAAENGIGIIAFSPLAQGMLTDKYLHGIPSDSRMVRDGRFLKATQLTEERLHQITQLNEIAKSRGQSLAQMALAWVLRDSTVTSVLIGASKPEQIIENCAIISNLTFTADELNAIDDAATSRS
jgi:L-glyceraldehyde 3-phosphate reductase